MKLTNSPAIISAAATIIKPDFAALETKSNETLYPMIASAGSVTEAARIVLGRGKAATEGLAVYLSTMAEDNKARAMVAYAVTRREAHRMGSRFTLGKSGAAFTCKTNEQKAKHTRAPRSAAAVATPAAASVAVAADHTPSLARQLRPLLGLAATASDADIVAAVRKLAGALAPAAATKRAAKPAKAA